MHNAGKDSEFVIKGPMGKGCNLETSGTYVAFAAGTGALVYLDLVARLILQNSGNLPSDCERFSDDFFFHYFVSFVNRDEAIGLDLCEALVELNKRKGINNFSLTVRLSEAKDGAPRAVRWNKEYVMPVLKDIESGKYGEQGKETKIKKVYVCGPPVMNECFDKDLYIKKGDPKAVHVSSTIDGLYPVQLDIS
jgi:NAD(P)H-flavin reductase